ncbi:hypothetical protein MRQ36_19265 [Micromonospora sp. R77]|uniref:hypothetical protein n=1 Tax=Micromonospora sp. R77 TaxID=2925836 RepID=UPI001F61881E|nr:hypothetical protein [Micromonospora sp. R77]MCI4064599.1 hypothetical protein [Micromonospora sp. R77]
MQAQHPGGDRAGPVASTRVTRIRAVVGGHATGTTDRDSTATLAKPPKVARQAPARASAKSAASRRASAYPPAAIAPSPVSSAHTWPPTSPTSTPPSPSAPASSSRPTVNATAAAPPTASSPPTARRARVPTTVPAWASPAAPSTRKPKAAATHHGYASGGGTQSRVPRTSTVRVSTRTGTTQSRIRCSRPGSALTPAGGDASSQRVRWSCQRTERPWSIRCQTGAAAGLASGGRLLSPASVRLRYVAGERLFSYTPPGPTRRYGSPE